MLWQSLGTLEWLPILGGVGFAFGRLVKMIWKSCPKTLLPWLVAAFCYLVAFGDLLLGGQHDIGGAALYALAGLMSGAMGIGFHETAKKGISSIAGETVAELILGALGSRLPSVKASTTVTKVFVALAVCLAVPTVTGCATIAKVLAKAAEYADYVEMIVGELERRADDLGLEGDARKDFDLALEGTRKSIRALKAGATAAEAGDAGDVLEAQKALVEVYRELYSLAGSLQLLEEGDELGAAGGGIPTPAELEARL